MFGTPGVGLGAGERRQLGHDFGETLGKPIDYHRSLGIMGVTPVGPFRDFRAQRIKVDVGPSWVACLDWELHVRNAHGVCGCMALAAGGK